MRGLNSERHGGLDGARYADLVRRATQDPAAKEELVKSHMDLVSEVAARHDRPGGLPLPDLIQEGGIGLIRAIESFESRDDGSFARHAEWWIEYAIRIALAREDGSEGSAEVAPERAGDAGIETKRIDRCGKGDCPCATYALPQGLTAEGLLEKLLCDLAPARRKLLRSGKGGEAALAHHENLLWRRLIEATTADGRVGLINGKCVWRYGRQTFWSGWKDVRSGRWASGRRRDARPERRDTRTERRGGPHRQDARFAEIPMPPDDLRRVYEASARGEAEATRADVSDDDPERARALREVVLQLRPVAREAIENEERRQEVADPPPLSSTERGRHRRALKPVCILILEQPALEEYHALARRVLAELRARRSRKPRS